MIKKEEKAAIYIFLLFLFTEDWNAINIDLLYFEKGQCLRSSIKILLWHTAKPDNAFPQLTKTIFRWVSTYKVFASYMKDFKKITFCTKKKVWSSLFSFIAMRISLKCSKGLEQIQIRLREKFKIVNFFQQRNGN